jgi:hypothetical protein
MKEIIVFGLFVFLFLGILPAWQKSNTDLLISAVKRLDTMQDFGNFWIGRQGRP